MSPTTSSGYPSSFDDLAEDQTNSTVQRDNHPGLHNELSSAVNAVERTLGLEPQGSHLDVRHRLDGLDLEIAGATGDLSDLVRESDLWTNVARSFGADPTGTEDCTSAVQAAVNHIVDDLDANGVLYFPPGTYNFLSAPAIFIPEGAHIDIVGAGVKNTRLTLDSEATILGEFIQYDYDSGGDQTHEWEWRQIRDLTLYGDSRYFAEDEVTGSAGVHLVADVMMDRVWVENFGYGVIVQGDHQKVTNCHIVDNGHGLLWPNYQPTAGNHMFSECDFTNNVYSSVCIAEDAAIVGAEFHRCHFGYSRVCVKARDGAGVTAIHATNFNECYFEGFGDSAFELGTQWMGYTTLRDPFFHRLDAFLGSNGAVIQCAGFQHNVIDKPYYEVGFGSTRNTAFIECSTDERNSLRNMDNIIETVKGYDWPLMLCTGEHNRTGVDWGDSRAIIVQNEDGSPVTPGMSLGIAVFLGSGGDGVETTGVYSAQDQHAFAGFAMHTAVSGQAVLALQRGNITAPSSGTINALDKVKFTNYGSVKATADVRDQVVGIARANASGGVVKLRVGLGTPDQRAFRLDQAAAPTADVSLNSHKITSLADGSSSGDAVNKGQLDALIAAADAMVFKGVIDCSGNPNYPAADAGHTYKVSVAGRIGGGSGPKVEVGDTLICTADGTAAGTHASVGANWNIVQVNIDGAVVGPASATDGDIPQFDGATGKLLKDGGLSSASFDAAGAAAAAQAASQPLDSDLTAIAALSTTSFGRSLLELADAVAGRSTLGLGSIATLDVNAAEDWRIDIVPLAGTVAMTGSVLAFAAAVLYGGYVYNSSAAQNDEYGWDVVLAAGTWRLDFVFRKNNNYGIVTVNLDGTSLGTVDEYNSSQTDGNVGSITGFTVATTGKKRLSFKAATKNASSAGYFVVCQGLALTRTA